jgi:hypothetical protein
MKYLIYIKDDYVEIFMDFKDESNIAYRGTIFLKYFLESHKNFANNARVEGCTSHASKREFCEELLRNDLLLDGDDIVRTVSSYGERQLLLWQNDLNKQGFLTKIDGNRIIIIDKI